MTKKDVQCYSRKLTNDSYSSEENMSTPEGGKKGAKREQGKAKGGYIIFSPTKVTSAINIIQQHHYSTVLKMCGKFMAKKPETNMKDLFFIVELGACLLEGCFCQTLNCICLKVSSITKCMSKYPITG